MTKSSDIEIISQAELDNLLRINEFIEQVDENSLVSELKLAILDSGKLELTQWESLRDHIREIEELIPHIDLIIKLKKERPSS
ncbi:hypothetical protein A3Q34_05305 [Colwellia sp. PAMC 20917]|jgi:hypothetical protein|uniref:hypothetical protein n=1 Tax=unclassified Colwellia TaxID=196834 RepID=UPI00087877FE|nr:MULTISPECIES: hypothetical protein [unclassified Colwellia]AOW76326.1 hypothetical protein A3Q34_05305 [Colwellia sp. PAMC 20917]MBA6339168.1 hypothetical protein [Colwellia sp. BRX8-7]MBA6381174.1 hypothetical protein [Colwellia sp. BRX10-7]MBA6388838.1 hypothetical protein [Colwellia sp. BRX10-2]MBA6403623.1 hypothetical protein [Colwellia sp. BRX10-5]|tara:strand:+ start:1119 stop:1367 length:249 start_codon:yes stop_codon:yes gene_type:complete